MKNIIKLLIGVIVIVTIVIILKPKKHSKFIEENNKKIEEIDSSQNNLFIVADSVIHNMNQKKHDDFQKLEDLNGELNNKSYRLKSTQSTLNDKLDKLEKIKNKCLEHKLVIDSLNLSIDSLNKIQIQNQSYILLLLDSISTQDSNLNNFKPQQISHIIVDTIYKIDTIFYPKDKIKVLKLRK
jgi:chromosome segregation ATPase